MKDEPKASLKRLERLCEIRAVYVSVAESEVKAAEAAVHELQARESQTMRNIESTQSGIAYLRNVSARDIQRDEVYLHALQHQRKQIQQSLEKANANLEQRRLEWTEAMREHKVVEKVRQRRLHQCRHEDDVANQKAQDDASVSRFVRNR